MQLNNNALRDFDQQVSSTSSVFQSKFRLIVLSIAFILIFTASRSIQNVQSSLNGCLGVISMGCVHLTMAVTCLFSPFIVGKLTVKWTLVVSVLFYLLWIGANFGPHLMTLLPTSLGVGLGQSMAWSAQVVFRFITIINEDITVSDVIKIFSSIPRPRLNPFFKTKNKTKIFFQYQDEDQDLKNWS
jgi:hypothetical protein